MATANIGKAYIQIVPSLDGVRNKILSGLGDAASEAGEKSGKSFTQRFNAGTVAIGSFLGTAAYNAVSKAMAGISDHIGSAIQRVDELEKFAPTLANIGVSQEEATAAIEKMADRLTGLPTTLDDAASSVKLFTSANADVTKSTDYFLALNDALVAGNAPLERQSEAMRQLSEAYSRGVPDMKEWRILMETMPGQMNQVAEAMGYGANNASALGEDLRRGNISMDEFLDTMVRLDTEGTESITAFSEQAQTASGSIATSQQNMGAAISRGIGSVIQQIQGEDHAINKAMESVGKAAEGILSGNAEKMKKGAEGLISAFQSFSQSAPTIIKNLIQNLTTFITQYLPEILPILIQGLVDIVTSIIQELPALVKALADQIPVIIDSLVTSLLDPEVLKTLVMATLDIAIALAEALPDTIQAILDIIPALIDSVVSVLLDPEVIMKLLKASFEIVVALAKGIIVAIPEILLSVGQLIMTVLAKLGELPSKLPEIGKRVIEGLWNGIKDAADWIYEKIKGFTDGVLDKIKGFFGIHSPSKVFRDEVGMMLGRGLGEGIEESSSYAISAIDRLGEEVLDEATKINSDIAGAMSPTFGSVGTESNQISRNIQQYNVFNQVADDLDVVEASRALGFAVEVAI